MLRAASHWCCVMRCVELETFLCGSSRPFIARDESGERWVIKACVDTGATKSLFNEYVAGKLANAIDLPWPIVHIAEPSDYRSAQAVCVFSSVKMGGSLELRGGDYAL